MALGVNEAFPLAMFVHATNADDIKLHHLQGQLTIILVDSVINTGRTIIEFVQHVRELHATIFIVVVAGVVQAQSVSGGMSTRVSFILQYSHSFGYAGQVDGYGANKPILRGNCGKLP